MFRDTFRDLFWLVIVVAVATGVEGQQPAPVRELKFAYGGGTPHDAGPLGHCYATFSSDGKVRIESKGRKGVPGPRDVVVYETESLKPETLESLFKAADAAFEEKPYSRAVWHDGDYLRLSLTGPQKAGIIHRDMNDFCDAPPAMRKFVMLVNELLPEKERIPLKKCAETKKAPDSP